jgi:hypothetical protein
MLLALLRPQQESKLVWAGREQQGYLTGPPVHDIARHVKKTVFGDVSASSSPLGLQIFAFGGKK